MFHSESIYKANWWYINVTLGKHGWRSLLTSHTHTHIHSHKCKLTYMHTQQHWHGEQTCKCAPACTHLHLCDVNTHTEMYTNITSSTNTHTHTHKLPYFSVYSLFKHTHTRTHTLSNTNRLWNVGNRWRPVLFSFYSVRFPLGTSKENICVWNTLKVWGIIHLRAPW